MTEKKARPVMVDQQLALSAYLDSLLREVPAATEIHPERPAPLRLLRPAEPPPGAEPAAAAALPAWAEARFQCLLFSVRGLTLAVPLTELCGIVEWGEGVTKLPERPPWFLGVLRYRGRQAGIIDTAGVVMPERLDDAATSPAYAHVVFFDEGRWGLACERVEQVITLGREQVRWRTSRTKRPWLAGTVIDRMCALLDVEALAGMIEGRS